MRSATGCTWAVILAAASLAPATTVRAQDEAPRSEARSHRAAERWSELAEALAPLEDRLEPEESCWLAEAYARMDQPRRANEVFKRALKRTPACERIWLGLIDLALERGHYGAALEHFDSARRRIGATGALCYRAARAYHLMGAGLGRARVVRAADGRVGQFVESGLLLERRGDEDRFLCCPPESAMYMLRRALDAGLDLPEAHWLHARLWLEAGRADVGFGLLKSQEERWLAEPHPEAARALAETALAAGELGYYLRYARRLAEADPENGTGVMQSAYATAAAQYNLRGDAAMCRELLRRASALDESDAGIMLKLADALWESGEREEAAARYRRALELAPDHPRRRVIVERAGE